MTVRGGGGMRGDVSTAWSLREHGAISAAETLTPLGALLASLPVDVNVGKLLALSSLFHLTGPAVTMAAALSVKSPFSQGMGGGGANGGVMQAELV